MKNKIKIDGKIETKNHVDIYYGYNYYDLLHHFSIKIKNYLKISITEYIHIYYRKFSSILKLLETEMKIMQYYHLH